jgi:4'-phosphopantetheinyl transferase
MTLMPMIEALPFADEAGLHVAHLHPIPIPTAQDWLLLSDEERARANRFRFERDRDCFVACRSHLRKILANLCGESPAHIRIAYGKHGKPYIPKSDIRFNVSHCAGHALIATAMGREVGVDIERLDADLDPIDLARRFFTPAEAATIIHAPSHQQRRAFLTCWTRKEACAKALGCGLIEPLERFDVLHSRAGQSGKWHVADLILGTEVVAAIAFV